MVKAKQAEGTVRQVEVEDMLNKIRKMLDETRNKRKTALAELKREEGGDPFKILIGTILSHRTRDENTTIATSNLFRRYPTPQDLAKADVSDVKNLIKTVGFHNTKAKNIVHVAKQIIDEFGGKVPDNIEDLMKLKSVGRKTANCVLVYGYGIPAIPVDTHVHRISNRLGIVKTSKPEETEQELTLKIPRQYWLEINDLFVRFGQTICRPVGPKCETCLLKKECIYYKEVFLKQTSRKEIDPKHYR
ncbi:MAG: endonuclease III [Conexivisphaerales archaeon]